MARILILDDEATNRDLIRMILEYDGHVVLEAADGAAALDTARGEHLDLVIVDLFMPDMNGTEFVRSLRGDERARALKVALYTGTSVDASLRDFMSMMGIAHVIPKPADPAEVIEAVRAALAP
jgi:CheY-like chemotaxis protein